MPNRGTQRGVGPRFLFDYLKDLWGRPALPGDAMVRDRSAPGGVRSDATTYARNPSAMSFLTPSTGLRQDAPANTRRAVQTLTAGDGLFTSTTYQDLCTRLVFKLPVTPTRFRIRWWNITTSYLGNGTVGAVSISGVWMGIPNVGPDAPSVLSWAGDFLNAPVQVGPAAVVGSVSTAANYVTKWIEPKSIGLVAGQLMALSIGINTLSGGPAGVSTALPIGAGAMMNWYGANSGSGNISTAAVAGAQAQPTTGATYIAGSWGGLAIEFEFTGNNPIGLWCGDSVTSGLVGQDGNQPFVLSGPLIRYPERVSQRNGHIAVNIGATGKSITAALTNSCVGNGTFNTDGYYARAWFDTPQTQAQMATVPDYAVIMLGTNDTTRYDNFAAFKTGYQQMIQTLKRGFGIPKVFALTIPPSGEANWQWGRQMSAIAAAGATSFKIDACSPDGIYSLLIDSLNTTILSGSTAVTINATNYPGTVRSFTITSTLTNGTSSGSSLNISGLTQTIFTGDNVTVGDGAGHFQTFALTADATAGAGSISITAGTVILNTGSGYAATAPSTLPLTSSSGINAGGGYAWVGGASGCIVRYTTSSSARIQGVMFVKGASTTTVPGTTTVVGVNQVGLELGGEENSRFELAYISSTTVNNTSAPYNYSLNIANLTGNNSLANQHLAGATVTAGPEINRQRMNAWLRSGPPGIDATIDVAYYLEQGVYSAQAGALIAPGQSPAVYTGQHPYFCFNYLMPGSYGQTSSPVIPANVHPRGPAWHNFVASVIAPHLIGL